jgi:hypothetical protein
MEFTCPTCGTLLVNLQTVGTPPGDMIHTYRGTDHGLWMVGPHNDFRPTRIGAT